MPDREVVRAEIMELAAGIATELTQLDQQPWRSTGAKMSTEAVLYGPLGERLKLDVGEYNWRRHASLRFFTGLVDDLARHVPIDVAFPTARMEWRDDPRAIAAELLEQVLPSVRDVLVQAVTARGEDLAVIEHAQRILGPDGARLADTTAMCRMDFGDLRKPMSGQLQLGRGANATLTMSVPVARVTEVLAALVPLIRSSSATEESE